MSRIDVVCTVSVYEKNGDRSAAICGSALEVRSHHAYRGHVIIGRGKNAVTVIGSDLITAIENAMRTA